MRLCGGPGRGKEGVRPHGELALGSPVDIGEQVQLFAGASAGNVDEAFAFFRFAFPGEACDPGIERSGRFATAVDRREKDMRGFLVGGVDFFPGEQPAAGFRGGAVERGNDHHIPFEPFCLVDGHEIYRVWIGGGLRVEGLHAAGKAAEIDPAKALFEFVEQLKVAPGITLVIWRDGKGAAEGSPGAYDPLCKRKHDALRRCSAHDDGKVIEAGAA